MKGKNYILKRTQWIPIPIEKAWDFFSRPENLEKITPPKMKFKILNESLPGEIFSGLKINYTVTPLLGIPIRWVTNIEDVDKPNKFVDTQENGPYSLWHHTHTFESKDGGTMIRDLIVYRLPLGILGRMVHRLLLKNELTYIFEYRRKTLKKLFPEKDRFYVSA